MLPIAQRRVISLIFHRVQSKKFKCEDFLRKNDAADILFIVLKFFTEKIVQVSQFQNKLQKF